MLRRSIALHVSISIILFTIFSIFNHATLKDNDMISSYRADAERVDAVVENAIEHGLLKKGAGGRLFISVQSIAGGTEIIIQDDGAGMTEERRLGLLQ